MPDPVVWLAGAALLAVVVLAAANLPWRSASSSLDFPAPVLGLAVELTAGEVLVRGDDDLVGARLRRSARFGLRRPRVHEEIDDDRVLRLRAAGSLRYEVMVPSAVPVEVRVNRGSASVVALRGPVSLRTGSGSVDGRALESGSVTAETASGSVRLWFDRQPSTVDVRTREGEVDLRLPGGPYDVEAAAGSDDDDCTVAVPVQDGAPCRVRARSTSGGVRIRQR